MLASCLVEDPLLGSGSAPVAAGFYGPIELSLCENGLHILETVLGETASLATIHMDFRPNRKGGTTPLLPVVRKRLVKHKPREESFRNHSHLHQSNK